MKLIAPLSALLLVACSDPATNGQPNEAQTTSPEAMLANSVAIAHAATSALDNAQAQGCFCPSTSPQECAPPDAGPIAPTADAGAPDAQQAAQDAAPPAVPLTLKPRAFVYGNSLVYGVGATNVLTTNFPARLAVGLGTKWEASKWVGRSGWSNSALYFARPHDFATYTAEQGRTRKVLVYWEGTNDLGNSFTCEAVERITKESIRDGWSVVLLTTLPTVGTATMTADGGVNSTLWPQRRTDYNACLKTNGPTWGASGVVDIGSDAAMQDPWNRTYYADGVHLTDAGYQRVADAVTPVVESLYVAPVP